jgi:hypothetical protein
MAALVIEAGSFYPPESRGLVASSARLARSAQYRPDEVSPLASELKRLTGLAPSEVQQAIVEAVKVLRGGIDPEELVRQAVLTNPKDLFQTAAFYDADGFHPRAADYEELLIEQVAAALPAEARPAIYVQRHGAVEAALTAVKQQLLGEVDPPSEMAALSFLKPEEFAYATSPYVSDRVSGSKFELLADWRHEQGVDPELAAAAFAAERDPASIEALHKVVPSLRARIATDDGTLRDAVRQTLRDNRGLIPKYEPLWGGSSSFAFEQDVFRAMIDAAPEERRASLAAVDLGTYVRILRETLRTLRNS